MGRNPARCELHLFLVPGMIPGFSVNMQGRRFMPELFVSYASVDRSRTVEVVEALRAQGLAVWIDQAGIAGGTSYGTEIANALRDAEAVLLIASEASLASKNVRQEIMLAWRYDKPIIPLILHPLIFPDDVAYWLEGAQWIEVLDREAPEWMPKLHQALARHGIAQGSPTVEPIRQTAAHAERTGNLPESLPPILGREREIEEVLTLLANGRVLTLTGPGGTGKTRLALEIGRRLGPSFLGGAWFLDLSAVRSADLILPSISDMLEIPAPPDQPPIEAIGATLGDDNTLIILDNLEQIPDASPTLNALQEAVPTLTLLMTSRTPLQITGEWVYAVPQLTLPDMQQLAAPSALIENPAVRLFVTRAQQARPDFQLIDGNARAVAEICHRLDGLPLAIEIAAARTRLLPPAAILTRLGSRLNLLTRGSAGNARQQTLRDTIAWSYNLLDQDHQRVFREFAVFAGGASVEAAEAVLAEADEEEALDLLEGLVDQSLLTFDAAANGEARLRMLETVREFAVEQLAASGQERPVHDRFVTYFSGWLETVAPEIIEGRDDRPMRAVRGELGNLRALLDWLRRQDSQAQRLRLVCDLFPYWRAAGPFAEAEEELAAALHAAPAGDDVQRGRASSALGWLAGARGDFATARSWYEQAMECFEAAANLPRLVEAHAQLAMVAELTSDYAAARVHHERRRALLTDDDALGIAQVEHDLGSLAFTEGDIPEGIRLISGAIETYRRLADTQLIAYALIDLASAEMLNGERASSLAHIREAETLVRTLQDDYALAVATVTRGRAEQLAGDLAGAQRTLEGALDDADRLGDASLRSLALYGLGVNATALGEWAVAERWLQQGFGVADEIGDRRRISEILEVMARTCAGAGDLDRAALLLGRADVERQESGTSVPPAHEQRYEETLAIARSGLGEERFAELWEEGRGMEASELIG